MSGLIYLLIALIVFVLVFILLIKIVKTIVFTLLIIGVLVLAVVGCLVYADIQDIEKNFANSTKLILFDEGGKLVLGFKAKGFGLLEKDLLTQEELLSLQQSYEKEDYKQMLGDNYKVMIFKKDGLFNDSSIEELPAAFEERMEDEGPAFIYREIKNGNIEIYPETPFFKTLKFIPGFIAEKMRMFGEG